MRSNPQRPSAIIQIVENKVKLRHTISCFVIECKNVNGKENKRWKLMN